MQLPFTPEQFFGVFERYNEAVWPIQLAIYAIAAIAIYLVFKPGRHSSKIISGILASLWLWIGVAYHWAFFTSINPAAKIFGAFFVLQGVIFLFEGIVRNKISFTFAKDWRSWTGLVLAVFGPILYPIIGYSLGHTYPSSPTFGLPCPTTIFTFGLLLMTIRMPKYVAVIPFLWSLLGFTAALSLGVKEDVSLLLAGLMGITAIMLKKPTPKLAQNIQREV